MTDRTLHVVKGGTVPLATSPTLREIGRHVADRNNLGPLDSPATLAVCVLATEYIERHSDDFEEARSDRRTWHYRGDTDADPLPWDRVQYVDVPEEEDANDEGELPDQAETPDDEDEDTGTAVARVDGDEGDEGDDTDEKLTFTLGEGPPDSE